MKQEQPNKINLLNQLDDDDMNVKIKPEEFKKGKGFPKFIIILIIILVISAIGYFIYQNYFKTEELVMCSEEAKLCPDGSYVVRVSPSCEFAECPANFDSESDWKTYRNEEYGFEIQYPKYWNSNEYTFSNVANKIICKFQFVGDGQMSDFSIDIWNSSASDDQIIANEFVGLEFKEESNIFINNKLARKMVYYGPSQILGGMHSYHFYIIHEGNYSYSFYGGSCMDEQQRCDQIISTFKFIN